MKWFIAVVMIFFILSTSGDVVRSPAKDIQPLDTAQSAPNYLPRVYAENIADEIYSSFNITKYKDFVIEFTENGPRYIMTYADIDRSANERAQQ